MNISPESAGVRSVSGVNAETKKMSSEIFDMTDAKGKVSEPGPGIIPCKDKGRERFFKISHPWSVTRLSNEELGQAMKRLKAALPKKGWTINSYGPNSSRNKNLELLATHRERQFSVNVVLMTQRILTDPAPLLMVTVVSACYETPEGEAAQSH